MASKRQIWVGGVPIGGGAPVAVQSMTKTETADFDATMKQIHAIAEESDAALRAENDVRMGIEGYEASKWVVQDYGDVLVHVFDPDTRDYYKLEELWADAPKVDWERE